MKIMKILLAWACTMLLGSPALASKHFASCEAPNPCTAYGRETIDGRIPDDGRSYIFRAKVTAGVPVVISGPNEVQTFNLFRGDLAEWDGNWNVPFTYTGPVLNASLSDADWSVYDWFFKPGVLPYDNCSQPGPIGALCGRHTNWFWNAGGIYSTGSDEEPFMFSLELIAVPEPSSWALLIAGVAMVGATVRRRSGSTRTLVRAG
ncbi:PEP-CTERM protein-sorting domain-containing protein [Sphingomonas sp. NFR04]|nr:PEP-CTERM protein-sorting domain-containing protein [Sphingomonas sp. NFR04]